ncbi:hypothetical protein FSARC_10320 [Fusarium sarcochroum]|uniref:Zn(2)-C6 fungal-type domain-containing protein n=1 Tax=Fusarium sarcochroum TaxID=1208366 RepID=A0A8H4X4P3_9HYPO|nr:hypothetical protein FSARC_10320 [Fusarium sarcochroum]
MRLSRRVADKPDLSEKPAEIEYLFIWGRKDRKSNEMAATSGEEPVYKRRRVAQACQTCRRMKAKCDGRKPECGRCVGYGFTCLYAKSRSSRRRDVEEEVGDDGTSLEAIDELRDVIDGYDDLVRRLLSNKKQSHFDSKEAHNKVGDRAKKALDRVAAITNTRAADIGSIPDQDQVRQLTPSQNQHRYLGEVSDVHFFNLVKGFLQTQDLSNLEQDFDSYEQDGEVSATHTGSNGPTALPGPVETKELVKVYFSTIHIAYPFIPQSTFMATWGGFQSLVRDGKTPTNATDLAILLSKTDSCWATLGQAVRIAQSIGLHVESLGSKSRSATELERRRRIWYSIYVLDRLLSLQLGRPPAIHDEDCGVALPSRRADNEIDWTSSMIEPAEEGPSAGDYFIGVIAFSHVVGCVLRDIYGPVHVRPTPEMMLSTQTLDQKLVEWKFNLPRKLRFDLGHSFDQNITFRRQRNMLAIKFHHLRALIHRPYLCYPLLRQLDDPSIGLPQLDWPLIAFFEKTCVDEARETARLLHHVSDEQDLIHEFPWWQMISCLICAGSILLVSSIFAQQSADDHNGFDSEGLRDDAETCLKIFEALSSNSKSAGVARDMIKGLEQCGSEWRKKNGQGPDAVLLQQVLRQPDNSIPLQYASSSADPVAQEMLTLDDQNIAFLPDTPSTPRNWPAEIIDSMAWSSQFFGAVQGGGTVSEDERA